jgi:hypothetical protein
MKFRSLLAVLALAWVGHSVDAHAQAFLQDPRVAEGLGIKAGDWELHPGVAAEVGYDSNYFQASGRNDPQNQEPVIDAWRLRLTPSISFTSRGKRAGLEGGGPPPTLKLSGNAAVSYNLLIPNGGQYSDQVSDQSHLAETVSLGLDILPGRRVGGDLSAGFVRTVEASNDPDIPNAFRRDTVLGGAGVVWRPGGGLFMWRVGYGVRATFFEQEEFQSANTLQHAVTTTNRWRFLPRTQIVYKGGVSWTSYLNNPQTVGGGTSMESQIGVNGLITNHWGALALVGWSSTFFSAADPNIPPQNYDSIVGQAEVTWYPMPQPKLLEGERPIGLSAVSLGYHRNWSISYLGEYFQRDRGYAKMVYFFAQRFVFLLTGGLSHITRPPSYFPNGALQYNGNGPENRVDLTAFLEYRVGAAFGVNTTFRYDAEVNDVFIPGAPATAANPNPAGDELKFSRWQVYLGARWFL